MSKALDILIISAGIGGLSAAISILSTSPQHYFTLLENAPALGEIGAGIQITPNFKRLLHSWGLAEPLAKHGCKPLRMRQVRWQTGQELTRFSLNDGDSMEKTVWV
jgi:salicylate hydroxylase